MKYSFKCPADEFVAAVEAENDDDAVAKLVGEAGGHAAKNHPEMANMPPDQVKEMVRSAMRKG